jgi:exo-beta-1,3-glucanase (GH17 family)
VQLPSVRAAPMQRFPCVSYSPFRHPDINPFNYLAKVTVAQIEADLNILKSHTNCIRTYGLTQGLDSVPEVARKIGMKVRLGVWLARDPVQNQAQLERGLALARLYPDVIDLLVVGNEVLLRKELTPHQLAKILQEAKAKSPVPITYADVWEFWQRHSELAQSVDVVTVHILPYWEDEPVAVDQAAQHVRDIGLKMQQHFVGKPVWIGETGWPAAGRQRDGAIPGRVQQSAFVRDLLLLQPFMTQDFNVIEAFDQDWKRSFEGAMGGYWGMFDARGQARVSFAGAVVEDAYWWRGWAAAGLGALLGLAMIWLAQRRMNLAYQKSYALWVGTLGGSLWGATCAVQLFMMTWWDRSWFETSISMGLMAVSTVVTVLTLSQLIQLIAALDAGATDSAQASAEHASRRLARLAHAARQGLLFCAASAALVLLLDARYRPFPWWWFLAPTISWLALYGSAAHACCQTDYQAQRVGIFLAWALGLSAIGCMLQEGWRNAQALSYGALLLSLAAVALMSSLAKTRPAKSAAGALISVE